MNSDDVNKWIQPRRFDLGKSSDAEVFEELKSKKDVLIFDKIDEAIRELYEYNFPKEAGSIDAEKLANFSDDLTKGSKYKYGSWFFYPWSSRLVHFPPAMDLRKLRGSRNRNLITEQERNELINDKTIAIFGLSVGSNVADSLLMQGIGDKYVLVDLDVLDPTNLNRVRAGYHEIGTHKVDIVAKKISELDPYVEQVHYKNGLNEENLEEILSVHMPNLLIDEMDDLRMKILVRERAKKIKVPVVMATDNGDSIVLDIERFDLGQKQSVFHDQVPQKVIDRVVSGVKLSKQELGAIIGQYFVDLENVPLRMIQSLTEVGKSLPSWPQLGPAAVLSGLYTAYAARKILLGQDINSGRFHMGPDELLNPEIRSSEYLEKKKKLIDALKAMNN